MPERRMAGGVPAFDSRHELSYDSGGCIAGKQCFPKPEGVHLIFADSWSKGWGQPQCPIVANLNAITGSVSDGGVSYSTVD